MMYSKAIRKPFRIYKTLEAAQAAREEIYYESKTDSYYGVSYEEYILDDLSFIYQAEVDKILQKKVYEGLFLNESEFMSWLNQFPKHVKGIDYLIITPNDRKIYKVLHKKYLEAYYG